MKFKITAAIMFMTALVLLFPGICTKASADEIHDEIGTDELREALPGDAEEALDELGLSADEPQTVLELTEQDIFQLILSSFSESFTLPAGVLTSLLVMIIICSVYEASLNHLSPDRGGAYKYLIAVIICCIMVVPLSKSIYRAGEIIHLVGFFINTFIPVYCASLLLCGRAAAAAAYGGSAFLMSETVTTVSYSVISPACSMVLALNVAGSLSAAPETVSRFSSGIVKAVKWLLGILMTVFSAVLTLRSTAAGAADNLLSKTGKFVVSTTLPVVGASVSDAYSAVRSSAALARTGVGLYGIIAVCVIMLPALAELVLFKVALGVSSISSDVFGLSDISRLLRTISDTISILVSVMICVLLSFIISLSAIMLAGGNSV